MPAELHGLVTFDYAWLVLAIAERGIAQLGGEHRLIGIAASLTALWIVLRASALVPHDVLLARAVATVAGVVSLSTSSACLRRRRQRSTTCRSRSVRYGFPLLLVLKGVFIVPILLRIAHGLARVINTRLQRVAALSPRCRS